jgi:voltage-gated potassium channel
VSLLDRRDFDTLGEGLWGAVQTVTTVGYGDVAPWSGVGRLIGAVVMVTGIGFLTVVTAAITATFVESARRRLGPRHEDPLAAQLRDVAETLERIERRFDDGRPLDR